MPSHRDPSTKVEKFQRRRRLNGSFQASIGYDPNDRHQAHRRPCSRDINLSNGRLGRNAGTIWKYQVLLAQYDTRRPSLAFWLYRNRAAGEHIGDLLRKIISHIFRKIALRNFHRNLGQRICFGCASKDPLGINGKDQRHRSHHVGKAGKIDIFTASVKRQITETGPQHPTLCTLLDGSMQSCADAPKFRGVHNRYRRSTIEILLLH